MATVPTTTVVPQNKETPRSAKEVAELASKFVAALLFSVYVFGFLIISLHTSVYGFAAINPLRAKVLAAGAWFLAFLTLPAMLALGFRKSVLEALRKQEWFRLGRGALFLYLSCVSISTLAAPVFDYPRSAAPVTFGRPDWIEVGLWLAAGVLVMVITNARLQSRRTQITAGICFASVPIYWSVWNLNKLFQGDFAPSDFTVWIFALTVFILFEMNYGRVDADRFAILLPSVLVVIGFFAAYYYPRIKASWGGGGPIPVVLYLSKESPVAPGKQIQAVLLDETDAGYYVVPAHESKAIFFPRSATSVLFFSNKISDSPLLRTGTQ